MTTVTADGYKVKVTAHIELPGQLTQVKPNCGGIGLLEVGPLTGNILATSEDSLLDVLMEAGRAVGGRPVTVLISDVFIIIRTLSI